MNTLEVSALPPREVDLESIEAGPGPYCMSFEFELEPLTRSLEESGLINPLLVRERDDRRYDVVTGFRRLTAAKALGWTRIHCRILGPSDLRPLQCLRINLHDNLGLRPFNPVEKGMALDRLRPHVGDPELLQRYLPLLGLPPRRETLSFFLALERELDEAVRQDVARGKLSLPSAKALLALDARERSKVASVMRKFRFNINEQRQFIEYVIDIACIENTSISHVLSRRGPEDLPFAPLKNTPQEAKVVLGSLRKRRYPTMTRAESAFRAAVSRLSLPASTRITAPPYFEDPDYRLEIRFRDGSALRSSLRYLAGMEGLETLTDPWETGG